MAMAYFFSTGNSGSGQIQQEAFEKNSPMLATLF
jgi:hypothetical protein